MISSKNKSVLYVFVIIFSSAVVYGIFEAIIKSLPSIPRDWPWGYLYAFGVYVFLFPLVVFALRKYNIFKTKVVIFRIIVFFLIWTVIEDFSYWFMERSILNGSFGYPFPVNNWWAVYFPYIGGVIGMPSFFNMPFYYFFVTAMFLIYLVWELKFNEK